MSSSVCHAPLPARMEAFTTRICLRAVDHYERILHSHFNKPSSGKEASTQQRRSNGDGAKQQHEQDNGQACGYSAVGAFRHWRRNNSNNAGPATDTPKATQPSTWPPAAATPDRATLHKLHNFPLALSDASLPDQDLSLKFLALNALDLTAPASDVLLKNRLASWFQLSGHPDGFAPAGPGTVWKRRQGGPENTERLVYEALSRDEALRDCIPRYYREVEYRGETFIELQDLLFGFSDPHVIDIKLGTRTFLESEVSNTLARPDLYRKMLAVDPAAPSPEEHRRQAVTKLRYMQFREQQSSTCSHGFRIEAMKLPGRPPITDLKTLKHHHQVLSTLRLFLGGRDHTRQLLLDKLVQLRAKLERSHYFLTHEVIGSSIFMIYDNDKVGVWLIDFAKTCEVPNGAKLTHRREWQQGNHEEGFLFGLDNLISTLQQID